MPQNSGKPQRKPTISHQLAGFYNRDGACLPRGTNWIFKYSSGTELQASSAASPTANSCQKSRSTAEVGLSSRSDADWLAPGFWSNSWTTAHTDHRTHKKWVRVLLCGNRLSRKHYKRQRSLAENVIKVERRVATPRLWTPTQDMMRVVGSAKRNWSQRRFDCSECYRASNVAFRLLFEWRKTHEYIRTAKTERKCSNNSNTPISLRHQCWNGLAADEFC